MYKIFCFSCCSIFVIKYHGQKQLRDESLYFVNSSEERKVHYDEKFWKQTASIVAGAGSRTSHLHHEHSREKVGMEERL